MRGFSRGGRLVQRSHIIDTVTNDTDLPYNALMLHPDTARVLEADDFRSYANFAAFSATLAGRFANSHLVGNAAFETVDGRQCLTAYEWTGNGAGVVFLNAKELDAPLTRVWWRGQYWIPSSVHANNNSIGLDYPADTTDFDFEADTNYNIGLSPAENWRIGVSELAYSPASLASVQNRWIDVVWLLDAEEQEFYVWVDGVLIGTLAYGAASVGVITLFLQPRAFTPNTADPTNNKVHCRLFEFMDGSDGYNPYSGLEAWE